MEADALGARVKARASAPARQSAKAPSGTKRQREQVVRVTLHLGESTQKRLNVHAALVSKNASRVAEEVLSGWLRRFGKGREVFGDSLEPSDVPLDSENIGEV